MSTNVDIPKIQAQMKLAGVSLKVLAEKIGVNYSTLGGYMAAIRPMPIKILLQIDKVLKNAYSERMVNHD
jgi:lambda repressor-like predicted transcriptional regulator